MIEIIKKSLKEEGGENLEACQKFVFLHSNSSKYGESHLRESKIWSEVLFDINRPVLRFFEII
jgi:hypothetical protein